MRRRAWRSATEACGTWLPVRPEDVATVRPYLARTPVLVIGCGPRLCPFVAAAVWGLSDARCSGGVGRLPCPSGVGHTRRRGGRGRLDRHGHRPQGLLLLGGQPGSSAG